jgi:tRNA dimethylallyltransferase
MPRSFPPTLSDRLRVPHHLIDVANPDETWSLATFKNAALQIIESIHARRRLPILVGGTGQYIYSILEGWDIPEVKPDAALRQALERWGKEITADGLHQRLAVLDRKAAQSIDPNNVRRTIRAIEVILTTGMPFSTQKTRSASPYRTLILGLTRPRAELYQRIDERIQAMIEAGLVEEVRQLLDQGYSPNLPTLSAIGYRQILSYLQGEISLEEAIQLVKRQTRIFVRRQANWFKIDDPDIHWVNAGLDAVDSLEVISVNWLSGDRQEN